MVTFILLAHDLGNNNQACECLSDLYSSSKYLVHITCKEDLLLSMVLGSR